MSRDFVLKIHKFICRFLDVCHHCGGHPHHRYGPGVGRLSFFAPNTPRDIMTCYWCEGTGRYEARIKRQENQC